MSLIPFEEIFYPEHQYSLWPTAGYWNRPSVGIVSSMLNDGFRNLQQLERELGQFSDGAADGKGLSFRCNVAGYRPNELKVDLEGDQLVISGEHKDNSAGQSVHRTFVRRVTVPNHIVKESIKCDMDEQGRLHVTGQSNDVPAVEKQNIPIGFKKSDSKAVDGGDAGKKK